MSARFFYLLCGLAYIQGVKADTFNGDKVLRITSSNEKQVDFLRGWIKDSKTLDVWKDVGGPGSNVDIHIRKADLTTVTTMLDDHHIQYRVMVSDIGQMLNQEESTRRKTKNMFSSDEYDYKNYGTLSEIHAELKRLAATNSKKATLFSVGKSYENRDQLGVRITNGDGVNKPIIWLNGGIHAREWISPATMMFFIRKLITDSKDQKIQQALSKYEFHVLPVFNVDGFVFTHLDKSTRLWRKTRSKSGYLCIGTDPNRNWQSHFGGVGTSDFPCSYAYHGKYAFSEIEVQNVATYLANQRNLRSYWDIHAYGQMLLLPWSYTKTLPKDYEEIERVSKVFNSTVSKRYGTKYIFGSPAAILYPVSGGSIDWTYETLGLKYSFALELRDDGTHGFLLPAEQIEPCGEETTDAIIETVLAMKLT